MTQHRTAHEVAAAEAAWLAVTYYRAPLGLCLLDATLRVVATNEVFASLGGSEGEAPIFRAIGETKPHLAPLIEMKCREALSGVQPVPAFEFEATLPGSSEARCWLCRYQPILENDGRINGVICALVDITERKRTEQAQMLLVREADHRSQNLLQVVGSIIQMTAAEAPADVETLVQLLEGRIAAVSRVHSLVSAGHWQAANLADIVEAETAAAGARVHASGPAVLLIPSAAQALAMVLHELVTNASKYGALSRPGGVLTIDWQNSQAGVEIAWTERGGPGVSGPPARHGIGSEMIDLNVAGPLSGAIDRQWKPEGLRCVIQIRQEVLAGARRRTAS